MDFEWDETKNKANIEKHGLSFQRVSVLFEGFYIVREDNRFDYGENRYLAIGLIEEVVVVAVVHAMREARMRIISARMAHKTERKVYYEALRKRING